VINRIPPRALLALGLVTLCGILIAGLRPFHSPKNQVNWLEKENGLSFGRHGTVLSSGGFTTASGNAVSCSIEVWLEPADTWKSGTLIALYNPKALRHFSLQQRYTDLALERDNVALNRPGQNAEMIVVDVFRKRQAFVTVTSNGQDTEVYIDGHLASRSLGFGLSMEDLSDELIIANSPLRSNSWSGQLRGLALYGSELDSAKVAQHFKEWTHQGKPALTEHENPIALYLFDERKGTVVHNQVRSGVDLTIPERYLVEDHIFLEPPWEEVHTQGYLKSIAINIAGFVPLGFFFYAYFSSAQRMRGAAVATVLLGSIVSFTIEVIQAYLPTRYSGITDIITNTLGTCIGVVLYRTVSISVAASCKR